MSIYDSIAGAEESKGGKYLDEGHHELIVEKLFFKESRKGDDLFIAEFSGGWSWVVNMAFDASPGNIKSFFKALVNKDEISADDVKEATGEDNPCAGLPIIADGFIIKTRAGTDFTKFKWTFAGGRDESLG